MSDTRFIEIHRARIAIDAHLVKGELEAAGMPATITDESIAALQIPTPLVGRAANSGRRSRFRQGCRDHS
jgi:hypothetical protein